MSDNILTITEAAARRVREVLARGDRAVLGLRLRVTETGCSGLAYNFDFAETVEPGDETVDLGDACIFIEKDALPYLKGSTLDYTEEKFSTGFSFTNPNEKGRCGCGESFRV